MSSFASTGLLTKCAPTISGIQCKSASADASCELKLTTDECGQNVNGFTRNNKLSLSCEGEITGNTPGGICLQKVGASASAPFGWEHQLTAPGTYVCTSGGVSYKGGDFATFKMGLENNEGV